MKQVTTGRKTNSEKFVPLLNYFKKRLSLVLSTFYTYFFIPRWITVTANKLMFS